MSRGSSIEDSRNLPGVDRHRRGTARVRVRPLLSHVMGYTGQVRADELAATLRRRATWTTIRSARPASSRRSRAELRGSTAQQQVERDASGRIVRTVQIDQQPQAGDSLELTHRCPDPAGSADSTLDWATKIVHLQRGVVIVMNPQNGRDPGHGLAAHLRRQPVRPGHLDCRLPGPDRQPQPSAGQLRPSASSTRPGSTYKLVTGSGALMDGYITDTTQLQTAGYLEIGPYKYYDWNRKGFGPLDIYEAFAHSSDTFFYQVAGDLGVDRLAYWAQTSGASAARLASTCPAEANGIVPTNAWKQSVFGQHDLSRARSTRRASARATTRPRRLQLLNAYAALANGGTLYQPQIVRRVLAPDGTRRPGFPAAGAVTRSAFDPTLLETMRLAAREVVTSRHYPQPGRRAASSSRARRARRNSASATPRPTCRSLVVRGLCAQLHADQPGDPAKTDSQLAILAFAYDSSSRRQRRDRDGQVLPAAALPPGRRPDPARPAQSGNF